VPRRRRSRGKRKMVKLSMSNTSPRSETKLHQRGCANVEKEEKITKAKRLEERKPRARDE